MYILQKDANTNINTDTNYFQARYASGDYVCISPNCRARHFPLFAEIAKNSTEFGQGGYLILIIGQQSWWKQVWPSILITIPYSWIFFLSLYCTVIFCECIAMIVQLFGRLSKKCLQHVRSKIGNVRRSEVFSISTILLGCFMIQNNSYGHPPSTNMFWLQCCIC